MSLGVSVRQRWVHIAQGMQQDMAGYREMQSLMQAQFHAALRHDSVAMQDVAERIAAQAQLLEQSRQQRVTHVQALLPAGTRVSMTAAFALLQDPLRRQLAALWQQLEVAVQQCKALNVRNCQLIMEQAQIMRHVLGDTAVDEGIYGPR
ncbi:MAG: flagellar export chaperone FlgN [Comamonas sp.]